MRRAVDRAGAADWAAIRLRERAFAQEERHGEKGNRILAGCLLAGLALTAATAGRAAEILIGTDRADSIDFLMGWAICALVSMAAEDEGSRCETLATTGPVFNLTNLRAGAIEAGVVPSDIQYHGFNHSGPFSFVDVAYDDLRALTSMQAEPFTLVVRRDSGIRSLNDLKGRRVNIGSSGSRERDIMDMVVAAKGWAADDFELANELPASQQSLALCHGQVESVVYIVAHPDSTVGQLIELCEAAIVEAAGPDIAALVEASPFLAFAVIPGGLYADSPDAVRTFGIRASLVSSTNVDAETAYLWVRAVFDNLPRFRWMHPTLGDLDGEEMIGEGLTAPLHEGAERYYREKGLV